MTRKFDLSKYARYGLLLIGIFPLLDLLHAGYPVTHDGQDHIARIANFYSSLTQGNIVPRWAGNLNWGYGHPILMFLYPLPSYIVSFFHFAGLSFEDSLKVVFAFGYLMSLLAMYIWVSAQWGSAEGFMAGLLYGLAPYRFVDMYVRGALGEHVAFVFPPLILLGLYIAARYSFSLLLVVYISISTALLILSHNAISIMFLPIILGFILYYLLIYSKSIWYLIYSGLSLFLGFCLSAFFWLPAFFEGKYTLRDIVIKGDITDRLVPFFHFIYSPWSYGGNDLLTKEIGFVQWIMVVVSLGLIFFNIRDKRKILLGLCLFFLIGSILVMMPVSRPIWQKMPFLMNFQFPWRFLSVTVFLTALMGGLVVSFIPKKLKIPLVVCTVALLIFTTRHMWKARVYESHPELFYSGIYRGTTDTGESSPIWSVRFMEQEPREPVEVIDGSANISELKKLVNKHEFTVNVYTSTARILDNTLYFPGWTVYVDGSKIDPIDIWFQDPMYRGLINFWVSGGQHKIRIEFFDTKVRRFSNMISIISLCITGIMFTGYMFRKKI